MNRKKSLFEWTWKFLTVQGGGKLNLMDLFTNTELIVHDYFATT